MIPGRRIPAWVLSTAAWALACAGALLAPGLVAGTLIGVAVLVAHTAGAARVRQETARPRQDDAS